MKNKMNRTKARIKRHLRIRNKIVGSSTIPRLSVFRSLKNIEAQLIDDLNHKTLASSSSVSLKLKNGSNIEAAKKVGEALAEAAKKAKITKAVFDRGGNLYHGRIKALGEAAKEKGLKF